MVQKETGARICYDNDPERLLDQLERIYQECILPQNVRIMRGHDPDGVVEL